MCIRDRNYEKELDWLLLDYEKHRQLKEYVKQLNKFYLDHRELWQIDYSWEGFSWIANDDNAGSTIAFMRRDEDENYIISICRFIKNDADVYKRQYMFVGFVGLNFLFELAVNVLLCPVIVRLIRTIGTVIQGKKA